MFTIDGVQYNVKCSIERTAEIKLSDISGMLLDGHIFNDVLGTYYSYDVRLTMPLRNKGRYATLIEQPPEIKTQKLLNSVRETETGQKPSLLYQMST